MFPFAEVAQFSLFFSQAVQQTYKTELFVFIFAEMFCVGPKHSIFVTVETKIVFCITQFSRWNFHGKINSVSNETRKLCCKSQFDREIFWNLIMQQLLSCINAAVLHYCCFHGMENSPQKKNHQENIRAFFVVFLLQKLEKIAKVINFHKIFHFKILFETFLTVIQFPGHFWFSFATLSRPNFISFSSFFQLFISAVRNFFAFAVLSRGKLKMKREKKIHSSFARKFSLQNLRTSILSCFNHSISFQQ